MSNDWDVLDVWDTGESAVAIAAAKAREEAQAARNDAVAARDTVVPLAGTVAAQSAQVAADRGQTGQDRTAAAAARADALGAAATAAGLTAAVGEIVPAVEDLLSLTVDAQGRAVDWVDQFTGQRWAIGGTMQRPAEVLVQVQQQGATALAAALEAQSLVPAVEDWAVVFTGAGGAPVLGVDGQGRTLVRGEAGALVQAGVVSAVPPVVQAAIDGALAGAGYSAVPAVEDYAVVWTAPTGAPALALDLDGRTLVRGETGSLVPAGAGGTGSLPPVAYSYVTTGAAQMPSTAALDVVIFTTGQSFADAFVDDEHASEADAYTLAPMDGVVMPSTGYLPNGAFAGYQPARAIPSGGQPWEYAGFEAARRLKAYWTAQGWPPATHPRIVLLGETEGGNPIQRFIRGSDAWARILAALQSCRASSAAEGRRAWCAAQYYDQGQGNRGGGWPMATEEQFAALLVEQAADFDAAARAILGQSERVPTLTVSVQRNNRPAFVSMAPMLAASRAPHLLHVVHPHYAMEYAATGAHALVPGYRRLGDALGRALADRVFGHRARMCRILRGWPVSATAVRLHVETPADSDGEPWPLVVDSSGDLVSTAGLGGSAGFAAWDRTGNIGITSVTPIGKGALHPGDSQALGLEVTFASAPDMRSLDLQYASSAWMAGGSLGGRDGPRGLIRCGDGAAIPGLVSPGHTWLLPGQIRGF